MIYSCVPPRPEQDTIVAFIRQFDRKVQRLIRNRRRLIELLNEQKQAIINQAVTRGLDPNVRLKNSRISWLEKIPTHWEEKRAKYYFREVDERSTTGTEQLMSVSNFTGVTLRKSHVTMFMAESYAGHKICHSGDLVINTMWAWMGAMGVARQTGLVSPSYAVYRPHSASNYIPEYIDNMLRAQPYISEYICRSTGIRASRLRLYPDEFLDISIVCPPVDEQKMIMEALTDDLYRINKTIERAHQDIELIREYRTRLIADVVTGKVDVRGIARAFSEAEFEIELEGTDEIIGEDKILEDVEYDLVEEATDADN